MLTEHVFQPHGDAAPARSERDGPFRCEGSSPSSMTSDVKPVQLPAPTVALRGPDLFDRQAWNTRSCLSAYLRFTVRLQNYVRQQAQEPSPADRLIRQPCASKNPAHWTSSTAHLIADGATIFRPWSVPLLFDSPTSSAYTPLFNYDAVDLLSATPKGTSKENGCVSNQTCKLFSAPQPESAGDKGAKIPTACVCNANT